MNFRIHRGTDEIGGNCIEISTKKTRIIFDFGMPLVDIDKKTPYDSFKYKDLSIKELIKVKILPKVTGLYPHSKKIINALVISHPHMDHFGFANYINKKIPIYIGKAANELINISEIFTPSCVKIDNPVYYNHKQKFTIGDIHITPFLNDHSAFDAYSFLIEADNKKIFYTGDFRGHGRKKSLFEDLINFPPSNIDYLMMEGTNINKSYKSKSENDITEELINIFSIGNKINFVYQAGQNIDRIVSVYKACIKTNKTLVIDIYIAYILSKLVETVNVKLPYPSDTFPKIKVLFSHPLSSMLKNKLGIEELYKFSKYKITTEQIDENYSDITMIVRPSLEKHIKKLINIDKGNLIYSLWSGYKNQGTTKSFLAYLINKRLFKCYDVHSSGHADLDDLKLLVKGLNPKYIVPIHTFSKKKYKQLFKKDIINIDEKNTVLC